MENTHLVFYPEASEFSKNTYEFEKMGICSSGKKEQYAHTNHYISILLHCNQYDKKQTLFRQANA